jgi:hypothetical protein
MPTNRLSDLLHYIIWRCDPAELGATKLRQAAELTAGLRYGYNQIWGRDLV